MSDPDPGSSTEKEMSDPDPGSSTENEMSDPDANKMTWFRNPVFQHLHI